MRPWLAAIIVILTPVVGTSADAEDAVALARKYLNGWQRSLAAVVAEETYTQTLQRLSVANRIDTSGPAMRTLVSEVLLVHAAAENAWLMFRDVFSVDGTPVRDRQQRFEALFVRPDASLVATARRIADESARHNLGTLFRNLNTPATALSFLDDAYESSVTWRKPKRLRDSAGPRIELGFEQRRAPYTIRSLDGAVVHASGRFVLDDSGRISETELVLRVARMRTQLRLRCEFGPVPGIEPWVPLLLTEEYRANEVNIQQSRMSEEFKGRAIYAKHRVFHTDVRIVGTSTPLRLTDPLALLRRDLQ